MTESEFPSFKVIVAGSRSFFDYSLLSRKLDIILWKKIETHRVFIISGMAKGADLLGIEYARSRNLEIIECPAEWDKLGKRAGYVRNERMADIADACVCFWDGRSSGTRQMIEIAKARVMPLRVVMFGSLAWQQNLFEEN